MKHPRWNTKEFDFGQDEPDDVVTRHYARESRTRSLGLFFLSFFIAFCSIVFFIIFCIGLATLMDWFNK